MSAAIVLLLSPPVAYITGTCVRVKGGAASARGTWTLQPSDRSKPFDGFHRAELPEILKSVGS